MHLFVEYIGQFGRFQRNARLYLLSYALSGVTTGIFLVLYNLYLVSLGYKADFVGAVLFVGTIGAGLAIFPAGLCVDRFSSKWILIASSAFIGLSGIGTILFRQPIPLLVSGFIAGVGTAFTLVINAPFLTRNSTPAERPHLFSFVISISLITTVIGEVVGGALPTAFRLNSWLMAPLPPGLGWLLASQPDPRAYQLALLFAGLIAGPSFIPLLFMSRDTPQFAYETEQGKVQENNSPHAVSVASVWARIRGVDLRALLRGAFIFLVLVQILTGLGAGLFVPYFNLFFVQHLKASPALFGLIDGGANTLTALTSLGAPWLAARIGRVRAIVLTRLLSIPIMLTIGLTGFLPLAAALYPFRQGVMDMAQGILQVFSMEAVSERHRGIANSTYQATNQVAWAITASLGGVLIVRFGYAPLFLGAAACYLLTILILWGRFSRRKVIEKHESSRKDDTVC